MLDPKAIQVLHPRRDSRLNINSDYYYKTCDWPSLLPSGSFYNYATSAYALLLSSLSSEKQTRTFLRCARLGNNHDTVSHNTPLLLDDAWASKRQLRRTCGRIFCLARLCVRAIASCLSGSRVIAVSSMISATL